MTHDTQIDREASAPLERLNALLAEAMALADAAGFDLAAIRIEEAMSLVQSQGAPLIRGGTTHLH